MKTQALTAALVVLSLLAATPIVAKEKAPKGKTGKPVTVKAARPSEVDAAPAVPQIRAAAAPRAVKISDDKEPWVSVNVRIGDPEREVIRTYVQSRGIDSKKAKRLPPGLAKKVARGGTLPPGWQKKCVRGEIMPPEVYRQCHPLPPEVVVKLPVPPPGTILVAVHGKIVRLVKASREILDVFDVI